MALLLVDRKIVQFSDQFGNAFRVPVVCSNCDSDFINDNWHFWKFCPECGEPITNAGMARNAEKEEIQKILEIMEITFSEDYKEIQNEFS